MNITNKKMENKVSIKIDDALMSYVEALHFDFIGYEHIMKNILLQHKDNPEYVYNEDTCEIFMEKYREVHRKYNLIKMEILNEYVPPQYKDDTFQFEFSSGHIVLIDSECEGDSCGCK